MRRLDRLRAILAEDRPSRARPLPPADAATGRATAPGTSDQTLARLAHDLGATRERGAGGPVSVVRRTFAATAPYGRRPLGRYPVVSSPELDLLAGRLPGGSASPDPEAVVCFDLETTGLNGGAGMMAFLIGLGWFDHRGDFQTCQYFLGSPGEERRVLQAVGERLSAAHTLITFNGRSFDAPVTDTRYAFHRLDSPLPQLRHVDLLHPGRHLWRGDEGRLTRLERDVLGLHRVGDVPGAEIPGRYVGYLRSGDAALLEPVLEHNRLDLVSLGVLTGEACGLLRGGAPATQGRDQALGLGRVFERAGRVDAAIACYERAGGRRGDEGGGRTPGPHRGRSRQRVDQEARAVALGRLALLLRRQRRFGEAAEAWSAVLHVPAAPPRLVTDARLALAVHHEHRERDLREAQRHARAVWQSERHPTRRRDVEHRLQRLGRKLGDGACEDAGWFGVETAVDARSRP